MPPEELTRSQHRFRVGQPRPHEQPGMRESPRRRRGPSTSEGATASYACLRCRRVKKKCDRTLPECLLCQRSGAYCDFPSAARVRTGRRAVEDLNARVEWLSDFVDTVLGPDCLTVASLDTGTDLRSTLQSLSPAGNLGFSSTTSSVGNSTRSSHSDTASSPFANGVLAPGQGTAWSDTAPQLATADDSEVSPTSPSCAAAAPTALDWRPTLRQGGLLSPPSSVAGRLPQIRRPSSEIGHLELVRSYLNVMHRSYPFLDEARLLRDVADYSAVFEHTGGVDMTPTSVRLFLVMAIGCQGLCRAGRVSMQAKALFKMPYDSIVHMCLTVGGTFSAEILLLLTLNALFDPAGWSAWMIVGILGRQAVTLGLNQKPPPDARLSHHELEYRHRLFWSIFSVDRLVSIAYGMPFAVDDYDKNLPLPGVTPDEFAAVKQADHMATLQIARQAIALRELEGKCLSAVHLSPSVTSSPRERRALLEDLRSMAENWYTQGCLLTRQGSPGEHFHNTISWLNVNYHGILTLLLYPSRSGRGYSSTDLLELHQAGRKYVQSAYAQFQGRHLALNHTTLSKFLVLCTSTFHCHFSCEITETLFAEQRDMAAQSASILGEFSDDWVLAKRSCSIYRRLIPILDRRHAHLRRGRLPEGQPCMLPEQPQSIEVHPSHTYPGLSTSFQGSLADSTADELNALCYEAESLIREALGPSSVYYRLSGEPTHHPFLY